MTVGVGAVLLAAGGAWAQPRPDTVPPVRGDTIPPVTSPPVTSDTVPPVEGDTVPGDTLKPVLVVAPMGTGAAPRWSAGVWEWDRDALLRSSALTLTDLLEQIPGLVPIRSGHLGHPEAVAFAGSGGGLVEIYLDGFALDPLGSATFDLSRFELVHLHRVRAERRGAGLRIDLETVAPTDHEPHTLIEAGTGDYGARLFRGTFLTPDVIFGPLALSVERLEGAGIGGSQPGNTFTGWAKWAAGFGATTLQLELRRNTVEWTDPNQLSMKGFRQDLILRARTRVSPGLTTEAFFGASKLEDEFAGASTKLEGLQGGVRTTLSGENHWASATLRGRDHDLLPRVEADLAAGLQLPGRVHLSGEVRHGGWRQSRRGSSYRARAEIEPVTGIRPFVEWNSGTHGIPGIFWNEDDDTRATLTSRDALRTGAELAWRGAALGVAWNRIENDSVADFGLPFDRTANLFPGGVVQGLEVSGRIPIYGRALQAEGWYTRWNTTLPAIYLPAQSWRAALAYHDKPLPSGNLEITAKLELSHRAGMYVPALVDPVVGPEAGATLSTVPGLSSLDFYLQIRIMDVRAFVRWNNITHRLLQHDLPGRPFPGQRAFYGVKWDFWN